MKIRPVILCGGAGTRLWPNQKKHQAKQFIDFGGWTLIQKTLERVKNKVFDYPIISTNQKYLNQVKYYLKKSSIKKYKIIDTIILHRVGLVSPSDPIVLVATWSEHREDAFEATREIMEALKSEAPFWKKESTDKGFRWVEPQAETSEDMNEA